MQRKQLPFLPVSLPLLTWKPSSSVKLHFPACPGSQRGVPEARIPKTTIHAMLGARGLATATTHARRFSTCSTNNLPAGGSRETLRYSACASPLPAVPAFRQQTGAESKASLRLLSACSTAVRPAGGIRRCGGAESACSAHAQKRNGRRCFPGCLLVKRSSGSCAENHTGTAREGTPLHWRGGSNCPS